MECRRCNRTYDDDFKFCPYCGEEKPEPKICPICGFEPTVEFIFCPECGASLISKFELAQIYNLKKEIEDVKIENIQ